EVAAGFQRRAHGELGHCRGLLTGEPPPGVCEGRCGPARGRARGSGVGPPRCLRGQIPSFRTGTPRHGCLQRVCIRLRQGRRRARRGRLAGGTARHSRGIIAGQQAPGKPAVPRREGGLPRGAGPTRGRTSAPAAARGWRSIARRAARPRPGRPAPDPGPRAERAALGDNGRMTISLKTPDEIEKMRVAGRLAAEVLQVVAAHVKPGVSTDELDRICHDHIVNVQKATPANLGYKGYPKTTCISANNVICHGIPNEAKVLKDGDIINIDVTVIKDGWHGDTSRMYYVGTPSVMARR